MTTAAGANDGSRWMVAAPCALGALIGTLVGLSGSPVVSIVLTALIAGVLIFLSLSPSAAHSLDVAKIIEPRRITLFSLVMILFVVVSTTARANLWLGPSPVARQFYDLTSIGLSRDAARDLIVQRLKTTPIETEPSQSQPHLYSSATTNECDVLDPEDQGSAASVKASFLSAKGDWPRISQLLSAATKEDLVMIHKHICRMK